MLSHWFVVREETGQDFVTSSDLKISRFTVHTSDSLRFFFSHSGERIKKITGFAAEFTR